MLSNPSITFKDQILKTFTFSERIKRFKTPLWPSPMHSPLRFLQGNRELYYSITTVCIIIHIPPLELENKIEIFFLASSQISARMQAISDQSSSRFHGPSNSRQSVSSTTRSKPLLLVLWCGILVCAYSSSKDIFLPLIVFHTLCIVM